MRRHPARHNVLIDDKPRILAAINRQRQQRVTTLLARQGQYALAATAQPASPPPDRQIEHIADVLAHDARSLVRSSRP